MSFARLLAQTVPALAIAACLGVPTQAAPEPIPKAKSDKPETGEDVIEVHYTDNSKMKLKLLDEKLELVTKHGVLQIATADIRRIEFATRIPPEVTQKIALAISNLGHPDFKVREAATEELKGYRERAYQQLLKAQKSVDPEVSGRAEEIIKFIKSKVSSENLEFREFDVIHTEDSKITGRLTAETLRVGTYQFGELKLKLIDVRALGTPPPAAVAAAVAAPASMLGFENQFGKEVTYTITGAHPNARGSVWGTDLYTLDSHLQSAVVHAGLAKPGETVTVTVRIVQPPPQFNGSTRHDITTAGYGPYPTGAYQFIRK